MKLLRSWPMHPPANRPHVIDDVPRLEMDRYDYDVLGQVGDDILLIEWDLAVQRDQLVAFADRARATPDDVLVAPYLLYQDDGSAGRWSAGYWDGPTHRPGPPVNTGDPWCNLFAFGLTYLPQSLIRRFLAERDPHWRISDVALSQWHYRFVKQRVPIMWEVRPVHLHYDLPLQRIEEGAS